MDNIEIDNTEVIFKEEQPLKKPGFLDANLLPLSILVSSIIIAGVWIYTENIKVQRTIAGRSNASLSDNHHGSVSSSQSVELPVRWGDLGLQLVKAGVIDESQLKSLYTQRGGLDDYEAQLIDGSDNGNIKITGDNSGYILNLLWGLGLGNKNSILEKGPMSDPRYGDASRFASTGGWTIAKGDAMSHFSKHSFLNLTSEQQALVERVSKNVYRPCCNNSTYFPDCNHGMAMLGLLELMASQGATEQQMYRVALQVNAFWFPDNYATIAQYFEANGVDPKQVDPKEVLSAQYSSASGYQRIASQVAPVEQSKSSGGCGI